MATHVTTTKTTTPDEAALEALGDAFAESARLWFARATFHRKKGKFVDEAYRVALIAEEVAIRRRARLAASQEGRTA